MGAAALILLKLSDSPIKIILYCFFAPAPIIHKDDGGEAMKLTWATEKGNQRMGLGNES